MFGRKLKIITGLVAALVVPSFAVADDMEKLSAQNEYLVSQVVELRKKVKEYELAESLLNQQLDRERQRVKEEAANVQALSQQVVELKATSKKLESEKGEADLQQRQLSENHARLTTEVSRLTAMVDDLTKQLQEKTASLGGQQTESKEIREELDNTKRQYSKVNADLMQCNADKQTASIEISKLNDQLKAAQTSAAGLTDKDREIARLKNDILLKDSLLNSLGAKSPSVVPPVPTASPGVKQPNRAMQEKRDELFQQSGEAAGSETTGRKRSNVVVPTGKGGDAIQVAPDMESFGSVPSKPPAARGGTVDRAFEKLKGDLERQKNAAEMTPGT